MTEDLPMLRQTLEALQQQHAALDVEERMLEFKVRVWVLCSVIRECVVNERLTPNSMRPYTDRKEEGGAETQRGPAQELADRSVRFPPPYQGECEPTIGATRCWVGVILSLLNSFQSPTLPHSPTHLLPAARPSWRNTLTSKKNSRSNTKGTCVVSETWIT